MQIATQAQETSNFFVKREWSWLVNHSILRYHCQYPVATPSIDWPFAQTVPALWNWISSFSLLSFFGILPCFDEYCGRMIYPKESKWIVAKFCFEQELFPNTDVEIADARLVILILSKIAFITPFSTVFLLLRYSVFVLGRTVPERQINSKSCQGSEQNTREKHLI